MISSNPIVSASADRPRQGAPSSRSRSERGPVKKITALFGIEQSGDGIEGKIHLIDT